MTVLADYGLPGWDVFHQGLAEQTPLTIGTAVVLVGALLLLAMLVLKEPIGVGTLANVIVVGLVLDAVLWIFDEPASTAARVILALTGPIVVAIGSGFYIGVRLGPGPRDGIMTALGAAWHNHLEGPVRNRGSRTRQRDTARRHGRMGARSGSSSSSGPQYHFFLSHLPCHWRQTNYQLPETPPPAGTFYPATPPCMPLRSDCDQAQDGPCR